MAAKLRCVNAVWWRRPKPRSLIGLPARFNSLRCARMGSPSKSCIVLSDKFKTCKISHSYKTLCACHNHWSPVANAVHVWWYRIHLLSFAACQTEHILLPWCLDSNTWNGLESCVIDLTTACATFWRKEKAKRDNWSDVNVKPVTHRDILQSMVTYAAGCFYHLPP